MLHFHRYFGWVIVSNSLIVLSALSVSGIQNTICNNQILKHVNNFEDHTSLVSAFMEYGYVLPGIKVLELEFLIFCYFSAEYKKNYMRGDFRSNL